MFDQVLPYSFKSSQGQESIASQSKDSEQQKETGQPNEKSLAALQSVKTKKTTETEPSVYPANIY